MNPKTTDVFKTQGWPEYTYVSVTSGGYEESLVTAIENRGTLCLITGPSKTGKTTLVSKVCQQLELIPIIVRCDNQLTCEEFWRRALEQVSFERLKERKQGEGSAAQVQGKIGGGLGWKWLARATGEFSASLTRTKSEEYIRERILSKPSPNHLIPVLKELQTLLVVEDFHYLSDDVQKTIFQNWKIFVDEEVSVAVIGTSHHACDLAYANRELIGRITNIELTRWLSGDLKQIVQKGCLALNIRLPEKIVERIADESVGLPIVTQAIAQCACLKSGVKDRGMIERSVEVSRKEIHDCFNEVATSKYAQFKTLYERMIQGLRNKGVYKTYECLILSFSLDPIAFELKHPELVARIGKLPIPKQFQPPEASIKQSKKRLKKLQEKIGVELMEWVQKDDRLYIIEPTFLFYLRWRTVRHGGSEDIYHFIEQLLQDARVSYNKGIIEVSVKRMH